MQFDMQSFVNDPHTIINNISSRFSSNSEANASELLENLEGMTNKKCIRRFQSVTYILMGVGQRK